MIKIEHPYWGTCTAVYNKDDKAVEVKSAIGCAQCFTSHGELLEDEVIQLLDTLEEESRQNRFKQLLRDILNEHKWLAYKTHTHGSVELLAKAQLVTQIINLLDLDIE